MNLIIILLIVLIVMNLASSIISTCIFIKQLRKDIQAGKYASKKNLKESIESLKSIKEVANNHTVSMLADELIEQKEAALKKM